MQSLRMLLLGLLALVAWSEAVQVTSHLDSANQQRLKELFDVSKPFRDAALAYHTVRGASILGTAMSPNVCKNLQSVYSATSLESVFHTSAAATLVKDCKISVGTAAKLCDDAIQSSTKVVDIYHAFFSLKNLKLPVDNGAVVKALNAALKKDDSLLSYGYTFLVTGQMPKAEAERFFQHVEDVVAQADTVDGKFMQFEGGLHTTALVVESMYKLGQTVGKAPLSESQAVMFVNYLLSRKHIHRVKSASQLVSTLSSLSGTAATVHRPVVLSLPSVILRPLDATSLRVRVCDLMGDSVGALTVTLTSAKPAAGGKAVASNLALTASATDSTLYTADLTKNKDLTRGWYKLSVSAKPKTANKALIGLANGELEAKVITSVTVQNLQIGVADRDQAAPATTIKIDPPKRAPSRIDADYHQKVVMTFSLKDGAGAAMQMHQTFVMLTHEETKREIVFVALPNDAGDAYKFELDLGSKEKEFGSLGGVYSLTLVLGDPVVENPVMWTLADVSLTFLTKPGDEKPSMYKPLPEIQHKFREPEKRPPTTVSTLFTAMCAAPLVLLLVLWMALGANVSNLPSTGLYGIGFHVGLAAIFGLYYLYWAQLNMFQTLQYLVYIGIPTFFFGNRLLRGISEKRKG